MCDAIHLNEINTILKNFDIKPLQSFVVEGATVPAIEKDLSQRTGCNDTEQVKRGTTITAGSGVMYQTEGYPFVKENSGPGKHKLGSFMCDVCELHCLLHCIFVIFGSFFFFAYFCYFLTFFLFFCSY